MQNLVSHILVFKIFFSLDQQYDILDVLYTYEVCSFV